MKHLKQLFNFYKKDFIEECSCKKIISIKWSI